MEPDHPTHEPEWIEPTLLEELAAILETRCEEEWQAYAAELPPPTPQPEGEDFSDLMERFDSIRARHSTPAVVAQTRRAAAIHQ